MLFFRQFHSYKTLPQGKKHFKI